MDDVNEISRIIGKLQGFAEASERRSDAVEKSIGDLVASVVGLTATVQAMAAAQIVQSARLDKIEPDVADWRRTKMQGVGALAAAGLVGMVVLNFVLSFGKEIWAAITKLFQ